MEVYLLEAVITTSENDNFTYIGSFGIDISETNDLSGDMTVIDITDTLDYQDKVFSDDTVFNSEFNKINTLILSSHDRTAHIETTDCIFFKNNGGTDSYSITADVDGFIDLVLYTQCPESNLELKVKKCREFVSTEELNVYTESSAKNSRFEYVRFYIQEGEEYMININNDSPYIVDYSLMAYTFASPVWFPQWATSVSGVAYWDGTYMDHVYFGTSPNNPKMFYNGTNNSNTWIKNACVMNCFAMIAKNKSKTASNIFDIRQYPAGTTTGTPGTVSADPYTVFLASNNMDGTGATYSSGYYSYFQSSISSSLNSIAYTKFNISAQSAVSYTPSSYSDLYSTLYSLLPYSPEGIILHLQYYYNGTLHNHSIIVKSPSGGISVFDPGRSIHVGNSSNTSYYYNVPLYDYFITYGVRELSEIVSYKTFNN